MKNINRIKIGLELEEGKTVIPESKTEKVTLETPTESEQEFEVTNKIPEGRKMVEMPADVLEILVNIAKGVKEKKSTKGKDTQEDDDKFERAMSKLTDAITNNSANENRYMGMKPVRVDQIDKDDIIAPELYFCYSYGYTIWDDMKFGSPIMVPGGRPIKFKMVYRTVDNTIPKQPKYVNLATATVFSKKIREFLDNHSSFGIKFFKKAGEALDMDAAVAERLAMCFSIVNRMTEQEVISNCSSEGVKIDTMDVSELRRRLAMGRARALARSDAQRKTNAVKDLENYVTGNIKFTTDGTTDPNTGASVADKQKSNQQAVSPY